MRLCRFDLDGVVLTGFYDDDRVVPIGLASEAYCQKTGNPLMFEGGSEGLIELLPPSGRAYPDCRELMRWLASLDDESRDELSVPIEDVKLLVPIESPRKLLLLAGNYAEHVVERGGSTAARRETFPYVFSKPPTTTMTHPGDPVLIPRVSPDHVDWECELGVVIGRTCRSVAESEALEYVAGYTIVNDVTDRKFQPNPDRKKRERDPFFDWLHGKWHDTFCPIGPCILSADAVTDPQNLSIRLTVNGEVRQEGSTGQMIFPVASIIAFLSEFVTLEPGDIISTGTPSGVGAATGTFLKPGDLMVATISGIGSLENPVEAEG